MNASGAVAPQGHAPTRVLWRSGDSVSLGDAVLRERGSHHWTVRIQEEKNQWRWSSHHGNLDIPLIQHHLPGLPSLPLRLWLPAPEMGTLLVLDDRHKKPRTLALWCPFATRAAATLHQEAYDHDHRLPQGNYHYQQAVANLGEKFPGNWNLRDPAYYLAQVSPGVVRCALMLGRNLRIPTELAGILLQRHGIELLHVDTLEIIAGLAQGWDQPLQDLLEAGRLLAGETS